MTDFMPPRERRARHRPDRRGRRAAGARCDRSSSSASTTGGSSRGCSAIGDGRLAVAGPDALCSSARPSRAHGENCTTVSEFTVAPGRARAVRPDVVPVAPAAARRRRRRAGARGDARTTGATWSRRVHATAAATARRCAQSLRVLKALTYAPTGGIVAAPTTSLPERIGGVRNWDYRYCWLRDAALTLVAMLRAGLRRGGRGVARLAAARGRRRPGRHADHVRHRRRAAARRARARMAAGVRGVAPGADRQRRARAAAARRLRRGDRRDARPRARRRARADDRRGRLLATLEFLEHGWRRPDAGIWEVRGPARHFTHSKVMAWVAFDRAVEAVEGSGREGPVERWRAMRDEIRAEVLSAGVERATAGVHAVLRVDGARRERAADAARRLPARRRRADGVDRRRRSSGAHLRRALLPLPAAHGRAPSTGCRPARASSSPCSFWLADVLALQGRTDEARAAVRTAARPPERPRPARGGVRPDRAGGSSGNFPQAFTHLDADQHGVRASGGLGGSVGRVRTGKPTAVATATTCTPHGNCRSGVAS